MHETLARIKNLVERGDVSTSVHGFRELAADDILLDDLTGGVVAAVVVEEYPEASKGRVCWSFSTTEMESPCMFYGEFRRARTVRRRSSLLIDRSRLAGRATS